jgi:glycosyltransferase involved in cell wall biosynthesis
MLDSLSKMFTFCFPGSARMDKGFNRISTILDHIDNHFPSLDYKVYLQSLPRSEIVNHYNIKRTLYRNPRVNAYPASVPQSTLEEYIQKSHVVVMPYCSRTYKERSSAMMAESACYGRQIVAASNCGFSDQVHELGIGVTCITDQEMAEAIVNYALMDQAELSKRAVRARINYLSFARASYSLFFTSYL